MIGGQGPSATRAARPDLNKADRRRHEAQSALIGVWGLPRRPPHSGCQVRELRLAPTVRCSVQARGTDARAVTGAAAASLVPTMLRPAVGHSDSTISCTWLHIGTLISP